jgi:hypothetical protein
MALMVHVHKRVSSRRAELMETKRPVIPGRS